MDVVGPSGVCPSLHELGGNHQEAAAEMEWQCLSTPRAAAKINSVSLQWISGMLLQIWDVCTNG